MELSSTQIFMLYVGLGVVLFIAWVVTLADIFHQGGLTSADRLLWILLVTVVPVVGVIVYWLMSGKLSAEDPMGNTARRSNRTRNSPPPAPAEDTRL